MRIRKLDIANICFVVLALILISTALFLGVSLSTQNAFASNVSNQSVIARVNVSNTEPTLYKVKIEHPLDSLGNIDLEAGNATTIICNGSFSDVNGYSDIEWVNATLYDVSAASNSPDNNNTHYTNSSCLQGGITCQQNPEISSNGSCTCQFAVQYYANPAIWACNMTIVDNSSITSSQNASTKLNEIIGINIETATINFGNISVTQVSNLIRENITNVGNVPMNITVRGYGGQDEDTGQNLSMICDPSISLANITFGKMRYSVVSSTPYVNMTNITNQSIRVNFTLPKRMTSSGYGNSSNATYWRLEVPLGAAGICNGTIIFGGLSAGLN
jgi:hypothetical protein